MNPSQRESPRRNRAAIPMQNPTRCPNASQYLIPVANKSTKSACGLLRENGFSIRLATQNNKTAAPKPMRELPSPTQIERASNSKFQQ